MGQIEYDEQESLKYGAVYPEYDKAAPELLLLGTSGYQGPLEAATLEAQAVAEKIAAMLESGYQVADRVGLRPATPRDFCILLRSPKNRAALYVKALAEKGIGAWAENAGGYLQAREVSMLLSFLKALDNPLLDIELVAAMLSPLFGFTDDEITAIRLAHRKGPFYTALTEAAVSDKKAVGFLEVFARLRRDADSLSADRLILRVCEETNAFGIVSAMPMGASRRGNLLLLVEYAAHYHSLGYKRLSGFVGFLTRLEERGGDLSPANALSDGADVVRIMSVHRSKGLEYPVVVLADTAKQFNKEDLRAGTILHSEYGFACVRRDKKSFKQYPTVPMQAIRLEAQRSMLSEEMRILYVALTRAREKLIVTAAVKSDVGKKLRSLDGSAPGGKLPSHVVGEANSYVDWILMALLRHEGSATLRERGGCGNADLSSDGNPWSIAIQEEFLEQKPEVQIQQERIAVPDPALQRELAERMVFVYPFAGDTVTPAKLTVSTVARGEHDVSRRFTARPAFLTGEKLTAAEKGNAMHKFMQYADYENARDDLTDEIGRMADRAFLSRAEVESLSEKRLEAFFSSALARRIFASPRVWRELKFMAEFTQEELSAYMEMAEGTAPDSKAVLNGVADCVFMENGAAVICDYKTDRVSSGQELLDRYRIQLELYRRILSRSLGVEVAECVIYSFALSEEVQVT